MSKLKPLHIAAIGIGLIVIISIVFAFFLFLGGQSKSKELAKWEADLKTVTDKAAQREQAENARALAEADLKQTVADYQVYTRTKTVPLNNSKYPFYMVALWHEYGQDFANRMDGFMARASVQLLSPILPEGAQFSLPMVPPPLLPGGFLALPSLQLQVAGTYDEVKQFILMLANFDRATLLVPQISLQAQGNQVVASIPITPFLIVEQPPSGGAGAAAAPAPAEEAAPAGEAAPPPAAGGEEGGGGEETGAPKLRRGQTGEGD